MVTSGRNIQMGIKKNEESERQNINSVGNTTISNTTSGSIKTIIRTQREDRVTVIYHLWQWVKHAWLHSDLLQALKLNGEHLTMPGFQQWEHEFLSQYEWQKNDHNY